MKSTDIVRSWGKIFAGKIPILSIEITKECPLHCPGCYAYGNEHLGGDTNLATSAIFAVMLWLMES